MVYFVVGILGDDCNTHEDCFDAVINSTCVNATCVCDAGYIDAGLNLTSCRLRVIGDVNCSTSRDCSAAVPNSVCDINATCSCDVGYVVDVNQTVCRARQLGEYGCLGNDAECTAVIAHSECAANHTCVCLVGYRQSSNVGFGAVCLRRALGDVCVHNADCSSVISHGLCVDVNNNNGSHDNKCQCELGYVNQSAFDCRLMKVGDACTMTTQCQVFSPWSLCNSEGQCACTEGFIPHDANTTCRRRVLGDTCHRHADCLIGGGKYDCVTGSCKCTNRTSVLIDDDVDCPAHANMTSSCLSSDDCRSLDAVECLGGLCTCRPGYQPLVLDFGVAPSTCLASK